ncbi:MAG: sulfate adenylyltransferase [Deltaproteobacteria bacterium]|nr:sulfate adenylyltransferase [Deltaproteobacteria bacterium]
MIAPHGSDVLRPLLVEDATEHARLTREASALRAVPVSSTAAANAVMLGSGYFTPLEGFMDLDQAVEVADRLRLPTGLFWPVPILNLVPASALGPGVTPGERIALLDPGVPGGPPLAIQTVARTEAVSSSLLERIVRQVFGTTDPAHPGVRAWSSAGDTLVSGPIQVLNHSYFRDDFPDTFRTAPELRQTIADLGWKKVVAFQTRNPMHRAHEELCRMAQAALGADGILIHMLLGKLKPGDIPADVRDASIRTLVDRYFPERSVLVAGYGFDMLYAGPREALLHALFRQNAGCTHLIVGRDHAGVGSYYGPFDAQTIFDALPMGALEIEIFRADHTAWSRKLGRVVMMRDCPDHTPEDYVTLSGTKVRELLAAGQDLPEEFTRPEVAEILRAYYRSQDG